MTTYAVGYTYRIVAYEHMEKGSYTPNSTTDDALKFDGWRRITATESTIKSDHDIMYRVTFYRGSTLLTDSDSQVEISIDGGCTSNQAGSRFYAWWNSANFKKVAKGLGFSRGGWGLFPGGCYIRTIDDKYFDFTVVPNGVGKALPPPDFKAQIKLKVDDPLNGAAGIYREVAIQPGTVIPKILFTKAITPKNVPFETYGTYPYAWNNCTNRWVAYAATSVTTISGPGPAQEYFQSSIKYYDKWGTPILPDKLYGKPETIAQLYTKGSSAEKAKAEVAAAGVCVKGSTADPTTNPPAAADPTLKPVTVTGILFNPPPHISTRHHSPIAYDRK
jgi:hypothetical protein